MPAIGYLRAMGAITMGNLVKAAIMMVKIRYTCLSSNVQ